MGAALLLAAEWTWGGHVGAWSTPRPQVGWALAVGACWALKLVVMLEKLQAPFLAAAMLCALPASRRAQGRIWESSASFPATTVPVCGEEPAALRWHHL